ncbi:RsmB/NOP family class I SAM-dependent RNA methyltransferase [Oligoflexus tunisiensis]|uniref:RsmB/NOP family class I SAM-dependent RNA methyltransferase n=1 Tax=Oligoflexus tunisiensis TaxID=708132 RepID=UPI00114D329A|nr:RsmB/NOP family class I SAM-dependent RNA methyltransferase [Oligoflexus tunisiensis]
MTARLFFTETPRAPHLFRIWQQLQACRELPQVDRWLAQVFRAEKRFGKKDRQWYADAVFAALRLGPLVLSAEYQSQDLKGNWDELRELSAERLFFWLSLERADSEETRFPEEKARLDALKQGKSLVSWGLPPFFAPMLERRQTLSQWSPAETETFLARQNVKAPLWLRVNRPAEMEAARRELQEHGIIWTEEDAAWKVEEARNLQSLECLERGILEIQDYASQRIGAAIDVTHEPLVWDCCAGGGGKTLQIASRLQGRGLVFASDVRSYKLDEVKRRAERAGLASVWTLPWNGEAWNAMPREWQKNGGVDAILIDAPCSGTGTWRRSPDSKYRCDAHELSALQALQIGLFQKVLPVLKKGGQLIYATCSWLPEENEDVIAAALKAHPGLHLETQQLCGNPVADADTMFYAVLRNHS